MASIKTVLAAAVVALLVPVAAGANEARVTGPAALAGAGFYGGELKMATADGQRPVRIAARAGYVGVLDLGGDLKVRCAGKSRVQKKETEQGVAYLCAGRTAIAFLLGTHFRFRGHAAHYRVHVPRGAAGSLHGRFTRPGGEQSQRPERPAKEQPADEDDEEIPSVSELAAMLEGK